MNRMLTKHADRWWTDSFFYSGPTGDRWRFKLQFRLKAMHRVQQLEIIYSNSRMVKIPETQVLSNGLSAQRRFRSSSFEHVKAFYE